MKKIPKWIDGISIYCDWLYETNQSIIFLTGLDCINNYEEMKKTFVEISHNIVKIIPCEANYATKKARPITKDGIYEFSNEILFLEEDYKSIFNNYNYSLFNIKTIRNKSEHEPHNLRMASSFSGSSSHPNAIFKYKEEKYNVRTEDFIEIVIQLNIIFDKIVKELVKFKNENIDKYGDNPYLLKYTSLDFELFNKLLKSELLSDIGKAMRFL